MRPSAQTGFTALIDSSAARREPCDSASTNLTPLNGQALLHAIDARWMLIRIGAMRSNRPAPPWPRPPGRRKRPTEAWKRKITSAAHRRHPREHKPRGREPRLRRHTGPADDAREPAALGDAHDADRCPSLPLGRVWPFFWGKVRLRRGQVIGRGCRHLQVRLARPVAPSRPALARHGPRGVRVGSGARRSASGASGRRRGQESSKRLHPLPRQLGAARRGGPRTCPTCTPPRRGVDRSRRCCCASASPEARVRSFVGLVWRLRRLAPAYPPPRRAARVLAQLLVGTAVRHRGTR